MNECHARRILIVDDETTICEVCLRVLVAEGFNVECASNGRTAMEMIGGNWYDLILCDLRLPEVDGQAIYKWLAKKYPGLIQNVMFMTGDVIGRDTQGILESTERPFLLKPFTPDELIEAVKKALPRV